MLYLFNGLGVELHIAVKFICLDEWAISLFRIISITNPAMMDPNSIIEAVRAYVFVSESYEVSRRTLSFRK